MTIALSLRPRHCPEGTTHGVLLCLVLFLFIPITGSPLVAQTDRSPSNLGWLTVGMGGGIGRGEPTFMVGAEASFQHDVHLFSGRVLFLGEPFEPWGGAEEGAVLYGRTHHGRRHQTAFSVGPAVLRCQRRSICRDAPPTPNTDRTFETRVGLALSGQAFWAPLRYFGIGLYGFANIYGSGMIGGAMLALRFGKLR